jgi:hypothetical protein
MTKTVSSRLHDSSNLLLSKKKKGLPYKINIDRAIFHELNLYESLGSSQLKSRIEETLGSITTSVYYDHIKRMVKEGDLEKKDIGIRGKPSVFYSLSKDAKREYRLNIHRTNPEHTLFRKLYERLLFYEFDESPPSIISSEGEFDDLLQSEFNTTRDKLDWYMEGTEAHQSIIIREVYPALWGHKRNEKHHARDMREYWEENDGQSRVMEELTFICMPIKDNADVRIVKTEYWEINKNGKHKKYDTDYRLELPGVATKEFLNNRFIGIGNFREQDIEKAVSLLIKEGLLEHCMVFLGRNRYKIADQKLRHIVQILRTFHFDEFNLLLCKWEEFEQPTEEEKERAKWLLGEQESNRIFRLAAIKRHRHKELMKKCHSLDDYCRRSSVEDAWPLWTTAEHHDTCVEGRTVPFQRIDAMLENYKAERRNPALTHKAAKNDILEFNKYQRQCLEYTEQRVLQYAEEWLKGYEPNVLEEYKFLHHAIRMIFPLVFESADINHDQK